MKIGLIKLGEMTSNFKLQTIPHSDPDCLRCNDVWLWGKY